MLTLAATLAILVYGLMSPMLGVLLPTYALPAEQQGNLGLVNALGLLIASLAAGPVIDLTGTKLALLQGLTLLVLSLLSAPNASGYSGLLVVYFVMGLGGGIVSTAANSLVSGIAPERRGSALSFLNLFFGLGGILTTLAASYLLQPLALCYSVAALTALVLLVNAAVRMPAPSSDSGFRLKEAPGLLSHPTLILLALLLFLYVACEVGVWNWLKTYLMGAGFPAWSAGGVVSYGFAFGILAGRLVLARLKLPAVNVLLIAAVLIAITTFAMLTLTSRSAITAAVFCAGLAMSPVFPTTLALVGDHFPRGTATAMGIAIASGWLGLAVSSRVIGTLAASASLRQALLLLPLLAGAMVLVNLVLQWNLRRTVTLSRELTHLS
jgi:fucose permease